MSKIYAVGIGPGSLEEITPRAAKAIEESDVVVGYDTYVSLLGDMLKNKTVYSSPMKKEAERCRKALEYALEGNTVSVISSGDAGVYGMASLMHEVAKGFPETEIETIPGITACCAAAAILGAPLTHDFAVISLSDLLTPWEKIEKRLLLASEADFVICLYNPSSKKRADYLKKAVEAMLRTKSPDTPCGYVRNISRDGEEYSIMTLKELKDAQTDMFTTVIVGNSQTKIINGKMITPRGYKDV